METVEFTAHDRCDACGSQAYYQATKPKQAELKFCRHHYMKNEDALATDGWKISVDAAKEQTLVLQPG